MASSAKLAAKRSAYKDQCSHYHDSLLVQCGTDQCDNYLHHIYQIDLETRIDLREEVDLTKKCSNFL